MAHLRPVQLLRVYNFSTRASAPTGSLDDVVDSLLAKVEASGGSRSNIVAFSGGVDSSLVAALVYRAFPASTTAVLGLSAALPAAQLELARGVAAHLGVPLREVATGEAQREGYVRNSGEACFHCKTELYSTLEAVARVAGAEEFTASEEGGTGPAASSSHQPSPDPSSSSLAPGGGGGGFGGQVGVVEGGLLDGGAATSDSSASSSSSSSGGGGGRRAVVLFNGTNADDRTDPTRVGLRAAANFGVASPIEALSKAEVRLVARHMGLPNWRHAASPCLRSRLALGVLATDEALARVEAAEELVRGALGGALGVDGNLRVRTLAKRRAVIEVDLALLEAAAVHTLGDPAFVEKLLSLGFKAVDLRPFKSGSVSI